MSIKQVTLTALEEIKAEQILVLDVREQTSITDDMIICTGTSQRHVKSIASLLSETIKRAGYLIYGSEGETAGQWVLVDAGDVIIHIMQRETRDFYQLEKLWDSNQTDEN